MKVKIQDWLQKLVSLLSGAALAITGVVPAFADEDISQITNTAASAVSNVQDSIVNLSLAIFPVSLIIVLILVMLSHNDKKVSGLLTIAGTICIACFLILLVNNGIVLNLLNSIANMFKSA